MQPETEGTLKAATPPEYLRPAKMAETMGVSRVTLYRLANRPGFPASVNLSSRCRLFPRAAVLAWMDNQAQAA